ncbi:MAG: lysophospholipid acyltransferase family protein [Candidatus Tantalella remota]|nr:lysophospholipid acyltransferase family protein [Candidatus Tantalella remota]
MMYFLYKTGYYLTKILPLKACYAIAEGVAWLFYTLSERDRENLRGNLKIILGDDVDPEELDIHLWAVFKNFAKYLTDFFRFTEFNEEYIAENIEIDGIGNLDRCIEMGKGVIVVSMHLGNWELGGAVVGGLKYPISAIVLEHTSRRVNEFFNKLRAINKMKAIPLGLQVKECFKVLRRGEILAIAGDRDYTGGGIPADFFGRKVLMPKGAAAISIKTGAPIVVAVLTREKGDKFKFSFSEPIDFKPSGNRDADIQNLMSEYLKLFEENVRAYPDQWYEFRNIWDRVKTTQ